MDYRRQSTQAIIAAFMLVTVSHIAWYAGSFEPEGGRWLGWPYALAVEAAIVMCAYFTRWKTTRTYGWLGFFAFTFASGVMNVGYINPATFPAWVYALFPTAAIALLGFLYRQVDQLPNRVSGKAESEPAPVRQLPEVVPATTGNLPEGLRRVPADLADFRQMVASGAADPGRLTGDILASVAGVSARTGRNWLAAAKEVSHNGKGEDH